MLFIWTVHVVNFYFILGFEVLLAVAELELKAPALLVGSLFGISTYEWFKTLNV